ncbi:MAG: DUF4870 domain-containing protein [Candidatus Aenigmatarchaeota archaeon]
MPKKVSTKTSLGLDENIEALLAYLLGWITGIIFYLLEKESKFVKFHALQSFIAFLILQVAGIFFGILPIIGFFIAGIISIITLITWIVCMIKAYKGEWFKLPVVGEIANKKVSGK